MARPIYQHELADPDFQWLLSTYREAHPNVACVESSCLPVVLILLEENDSLVAEDTLPDAVSALGHDESGEVLVDDPDV